MHQTPALLMLDDGTCFEGYATGKREEAVGEVVFATGMTGYQETLSDPSYHGQIVTFTTAHVGNYGATPLDDQSGHSFASGAVFHELAPAGSFRHWRATESMDERLCREGVTGITGVDTRALTLHLRQHGARNGIISALDLDRSSLLSRARALPSMIGLDLAKEVSCDKAYPWPSPSSQRSGRSTDAAGEARADDALHARPKMKRYAVAVYDYGVKRAILDNLVAVGVDPTVWPAQAPVEDILATNPDGIFLSNGPGDPAACAYAANAVRAVLGRVPVFGICLGHQILAHALGAKTYKLPFGHHGSNHPVKDLDSGRVSITSQNHGFCVDPDTLPASTRVSHWNLNDDTVEGLVCDNLMAFSVQFHPEAAPGPNDALNLFARFRNLMESAQSLF